jgi:ribosome biogenesis protein Tsr3
MVKFPAVICQYEINIYHAAQDDPKKNTALRLKRRGLLHV